jgi:hypothetical protein
MSDDSMIEIARLPSRAEATSLRAMLAAYGIDCHIGSWWLASTTINPIALGHYRLTVPLAGYNEASALIRDYLSQPVGDWYADYRKRVVNLVVVIVLTGSIIPAVAVMTRLATLVDVILFPLTMPLVIPVSPVGRGDFYLAKPTED